jgi:hypothetical protein
MCIVLHTSLFAGTVCVFHSVQTVFFYQHVAKCAMGLSLMQEDMLLQYGPRGDRKPASFSLAGVSRLGMAATTATRIAVLSVGSQGGNNSVLDACVQKLQQHCQLSQVEYQVFYADSSLNVRCVRNMDSG